MNTHKLHFHDKIGKIPNITLIIVFFCCRMNFLGTHTRVGISNGKRVIGVRAIEVLLYLQYSLNVQKHHIASNTSEYIY